MAELADLSELMEAIIALQNEVETPFDEEPLADAVSGPPPSGHGFPCFFNEEEDETEIERGPSERIQRHKINMHLLFGAMEEEYSLASRRKWVKPVLDKFDRNVQLDGGVTVMLIDRIRWSPIELNERPYIVATFVLAVELHEGFDYGS